MLPSVARQIRRYVEKGGSCVGMGLSATTTFPNLHWLPINPPHDDNVHLVEENLNIPVESGGFGCVDTTVHSLAHFPPTVECCGDFCKMTHHKAVISFQLGLGKVSLCGLLTENEKLLRILLRAIGVTGHPAPSSPEIQTTIAIHTSQSQLASIDGSLTTLCDDDGVWHKGPLSVSVAISRPPQPASLTLIGPPVASPDIVSCVSPDCKLGRPFLYAASVSSTQDILRDNFLLLRALPHGSILLADQQVGGRGRGSNVWMSPPDSLAFTLLLHKRVGPECTAVPHVVGLSIVQAIRDLLRAVDYPQIKWPNDVYWHGRKLGGVLCEMPDSDRLLVGVGINVGHSGPGCSVADVASAAGITPPSRSAVLSAVLSRLSQNWSVFARSGFAGLRDEYQSLWLHTGERVKLGSRGEHRGKWVEGEEAVIQHVDENGFLILKTMDGSSISAMPDTTSFDMMKRLLKL